jgi:ribonuclease J
MIDLARYGELGNKGVLLLMADSTNVERPGHTMSERTVSDTFTDIFRHCKKRIIVATFASNVHRVQQIINASVSYGRKVALCGRSMLNVASVAMELGYLKVPKNTLIDIDEIKSYKKDKITIITTGSQGEPMSALTRMALSEHKVVEIQQGDLVIISASAIPGNEKGISKVINLLYKKGAEVIYESLAETHVSGHACQEELKLIHRLVKPKYFIPVHGEYRHLKQHANLAMELGMKERNIFVLETGKVLELNERNARVSGNVPAGNVLVDGLGVGDVGNIVLRDRKHLAQDGLIVVVVTISAQDKSIVAGPDIISRGFVYVREAEGLMEETKNAAREAIESCVEKNVTDWATIKSKIKSNLNELLYIRTKRKPMILPIIMEA